MNAQREIKLDQEVILRMKYSGLSMKEIASYHGIRYADFIQKIKEQQMLRELLK